MKRIARQLASRLLVLVAAAGLLGAVSASAQYGPARFDRPTLDSMLAPIALYPDTLLAHVLMAATYPEEVQDAASWLRARPGLSGDAAVRTALDRDWDPSVRALLAFPQVLETMASHPRWTEDVGDAFLDQRGEVMDVIQALRRRAYQAGTLRSNEAVRVVETLNGIVIEQAVQSTVYVPHYDPRVVYGGWWWPTRPPVYWPRWSGYVDPYPRHVHWGPGVHVSSGVFFGAFVWPRREVRVVHVHPHFHPHRTIVERHVVHDRHRALVPGPWRHDDWRRGDRRDGRRDGDDRRDARGRDGDDRREARARDDDDRRDGRRWEERRRIESNAREARVPAGPAAGATTRQPAEVTRRSLDRDGDGTPDRRDAKDARRDQREDGRNQRRDRDDGDGRTTREAPRVPAPAAVETRRNERPAQQERRSTPRQGDRD